MRARGLGFRSASTALSLSLLVVVIAFPIFAEVARPDYMSTYRAKDQSRTQQGSERANLGCSAIDPTGLVAGKAIAQATI